MKFFFIVVMSVLTISSKAQTGSINIWGGGLDGSTYQQTVMYSTTGGLLVEAPLNASSAKLPIEFNWRGGGAPGLKINGDGNVGIGTSPITTFDVFRAHDAPTGIYSRNTQNSSNGLASVTAIGQNQAIGMRAFSDSYSRPYPGFHSSAAVLYGSATSGLNIISDVGTGNVGSNTGMIRFITCAAPGGVTSNVTGNDALTRMVITGAGDVGIGKLNPDAKLAVNGTIHSKEVKVDLSNWSDFVFEPQYKLRGLKETQRFIQENRHLPEIPSAKEVAENGVNLGEMDSKLLQKIEELTLYLIEQNERLDKQQREIETLKAQH